ncbi:MAG: tRNA 4-thiouridine(8) synthase ThiI [Tissierellia bacterium]|nr:tRNA 4-thiouridine(8) synthase ThiI [Tissierellia bacterium]
MDKVISVSFGEIALKSGNRKYFEDKLIKQMRKAIADVGYEKIYKEMGKIYIEASEDYYPQIINRLRKVFGLVYISPCIRVEQDFEEIKKASIQAILERIEDSRIKTFKVETNRADKKFSMKSPEVSKEVGAVILKNIENLTVDVHKPDVFVYVDIRQNAYIYTEKIKGYGGLPIGTNGKGLLLLSGGIDSPVAGFMMARRGVEINAVHYHSYPFTSERAEEKVKDLAGILSRYIGTIKLFSVNIIEIQKQINKNCPKDEMTILSRRFMMRIAESIAKENNYQALITGENLGQVASQTIEGLNVTNSSVELPVFRPLIGFDKVDIVDIAKDIETYETSILPYDDCCTVFLPKHPVTKPRLDNIEESEKALDVDKLIEAALDNMKTYIIQ